MQDQPLAEYAVARRRPAGSGEGRGGRRAQERVDAIKVLYTDVDLELALFAADRRVGKVALA